MLNAIRSAVESTSQRLPPQVRRFLPNSGAVRYFLHTLEEMAVDRALPARDGLEWQRCAPCPYSLLDAGAAQVGQFLYVVCGLRAHDQVSNKVFVFDLHREEWGGTIVPPPDLAHSHCAVATDGERFIYLASGQHGAHCSPAVDHVFSFDVQDQSWRRLPSLPQPRYAGAMRYWNARLHHFGGAAEDRWTPKADHWSLSVNQGVASEVRWREEVPLVTPGMHHASAIVKDSLFVFGGQQGDFRPIPGDPDCKCMHARESYLKCSYRLDSLTGAWERLPDMPIAASHAEFATIVLYDTIFLVGGQVYKHSTQNYLRLTDAIQAFDTQRNRWTIAGYLPCSLKTAVAGLVDRRLYITTGQRGAGESDRPDSITASTWKTELPRSVPAVSGPVPMESVQGKDILLVTHELSRSGAPIMILDAAGMMMRSGANVRLANLADDVQGRNLPCEHEVALIPVEEAMQCARQADLVIVNTTTNAAAEWVRQCLAADESVAERLVWWVHENDVGDFRASAELLARARVAVFASHASRAAWAEAVPGPKERYVVHPALRSSVMALTDETRLPYPAKPGQYGSRNTQLLERQEVRRRLNVSPDDFLVCSIGRYVPKKGQRLLLRTLARARADRGLRLKLLLVGLSVRSRWALLCSMTPGERRVLSPSRAYVHQKHYAVFYKASDAFVMNTQGPGENFGLVTIEAMAFGLPVLGTDAAGTPEILTDGVTGRLHPVGEAGQHVLVEHLAGLVRDTKGANKLGEAGRERARTYFREERFAEEFNRAIAGIFGDR